MALVTGASGGIGGAAALALARDGFDLVVHYNENAEAAKATASSIVGEGGAAVVEQADLADERQVRSLFRRLREDFGRLDALVNCAGITNDGLFVMMSASKFESVLHTNLMSTFLCSREALKQMSRARSGAIVNVSSIVAIRGQQGQANYAASKAAIIGLSRTIAKEAAPCGVRVNVVAPGAIDTKMLRKVPPAHLDILASAIPLGRVGRAEEVGEVIAFLSSSRASYMVGQVLTVDGGMG